MLTEKQKYKKTGLKFIQGDKTFYFICLHFMATLLNVKNALILNKQIKIKFVRRRKKAFLTFKILLEMLKSFPKIIFDSDLVLRMQLIIIKG